MKIFEKLSYTNNTRRIISFIFYLVFAVFVLSQIVKTEVMLHRILYILLLVLVLGMALFSEYLKLLYEKAIKTIAFDLDPELAMEKYDHLNKLDKFKAYKNSKLIFDTLYYIDQMEYDKCLQHLQDNYKFFHASLDQLLIYHFTNFYCSFMTDDLETAKAEYQKLLRMKNAKSKGNKVSPLYNWEFLDAIYQFARKEYKQAYNSFKTVNTVNMNPREQVQYSMQFARLCKKINKTNTLDENLSKIKAMNGKSKTCLEIERIIN